MTISKQRKREILIGDNSLFDYVIHQQDAVHDRPHPLQEIVEEAIDALDEDLQAVFYMRYGQHMTIRAIARAQDYDGHQIIQHKLQKIEDHVRRYIKDAN